MSTPDFSTQDERHMRWALAAARRHALGALPNPSVGAVLVKNGRIIAEGVHRRAGDAHGEAEVIKKAGTRAKEATLYVTLEPCNHSGKTPPCTQAILKAGISRVVYALKDPNPNVKGGGADFLKRKKVRVEGGLMAEEAARVHGPFLANALEDRAYVHLKMASTLDGHPADRSGKSLYITGSDALTWVHRWRAQWKAVMVGPGTVIADKPRLTDRRAKQIPVTRIVPWHRGPEPDWSSLLAGLPDNPLWIFHKRNRPPSLEEREGLRMMPCAQDLRKVLQRIYEEGICGVFCEGGPGLAGSLWGDDLVDRFSLFMAPRVLGDAQAPPVLAGPHGPLSKALSMGPLSTRKVGDDVLLEVYPHVYRNR